jgi:DNA recombination protein Rad52
MTFNPDQKTKLEAPLSRENVKARKQGGRNVSYIEAWHAIAEANRIFSFDGWTRETTHFECIDQRECEIGENKVPGWNVTYIAKVRVEAGGIIREGCGAGHGIDRNLGQAHESAIKEAESDAMKRALSTFGWQFGLALYDKEQLNVVDEPQEPEVTEQMREDYIRGVEEEINNATDWPKLYAWWQSDQQKANHRKYLSDGEMEVLKAKLLAKKEALLSGG